MASVKNLILNFVFQTQGAGSTTRDLNNLNKAQTRLGQSSASAGRSFSSQSQGLGGLVAAYAGAAATTFALQQAFDKLAKSARTIQTLEGLNTLASSVGASGTQLLNSVRDITKYQLTIADSAAQINLSLSAGFNTQQIERLSGVALKASRALGRDLNDAYTRVVRGSAKMETELLDELGIYTKIEPATRAYAAAMGKSVTSLSEFERRQAFVNAVITEGERKFSGINTTVATTAEKIEAFGTKMLDLAMIFGMNLVSSLEPLIDFFSDNFPAAVALAIAAAGLLARKGIGELSSALSNATKQKLQNATALENMIRQYTGLTPSVIKSSEALGKITAATVGLTKAEKERFNALQATSQQRALTGAELKEVSGLSKKVADSYASQREALRAATKTQVENNKAIQQEFRDRNNALQALKAQQAAIRANSALTEADRRSQLIALRPQVQSAQNRLDRITPDARQSAAETKEALSNYRQLNNAKNEYTRAVQASTAAMTGWGARSAAALGTVYRGWSLATAGALAFTSRVISGIGGVVSSVAILSIAVTAIAKLLGKSDELNAFFNQTFQALSRLFGGGLIESSSKAINSLGAATLENLEKVNKQLKETDTFTFKKKFLFTEVEVSIDKENLIKSVSSSVSDAAVDKGFLGKLADNVTDFNWFDVGTTVGGAILGGMAAVALAPVTGGGSIAAFGLAVAGSISGAIAGNLTGNTLVTGVETATGNVNEQFGVSVERVNELRSQFGSYFKEIDSGLTNQDVRLASVLDKEAQRIGAGRVLTSEQKEYLTTFAEIAVSQFNQLKNLESIVTLSRELGKTAGQIAQEFAMTQDSTSTFTQIKTNLEAVAKDKPIELPVTFVLANKEGGDFKRIQAQIAEALPSERLDLFADTSSVDPKMQKALSMVRAGIDQYEEYVRDSIRRTGTLEGAIEDLDSIFYRQAQSVAIGLKNLGLSTDEALSVLESGGLGILETATDNFNAMSISSIRAADNFNTLAKQAREGGLTFEQFQQGLSGVDTALAASNAGLVTLIPTLTELAAKYPTGPVNEYATKLLEQAAAQQKSNDKIKEQLDTFKGQEDYYRRLTEYAKFLKTVQDSTKIDMFDYEAQTVAASKLISIDQARVGILLDQASANKKLADEAKIILSRDARDRQGDKQQANAFQTQALAEYTQSLEISAAMLRSMTPSMTKLVAETDKLTVEINKQVVQQAAQLNLVKQQAAAQANLISLRERAAASDLAAFQAEKELEGINSQIELNKTLFGVEESRAERAKSQLEMIQQAVQDSYARQIDAVEAVEAAEDRASKSRISALERQISLIGGIRDLSKNVDQAITALQLSFLKAPTVEQAPVQDTFSKELDLRRQILAEEISAAERSAEAQKDVITLKAAQDKSALASQMTQLDIEKNLQQSRVNLLRQQLNLVAASEAAEIKILRAQDDSRKSNAAVDLANLKEQKRQSAVKYLQDLQSIEADRQASIQKATDDINANIRYLQSIQAQKEVFDDFLTEYGALIKVQASTTGKQVNIPASDRDTGKFNFDATLKSLQDSKTAISNAYNNLYSLQAQSALITAESSQAAIDQEINAITAKTAAEDVAFEKSMEARQELKAANISSTEEELRAAEAALQAIGFKRDELAKKIKDIETRLGNDISAINAKVGEDRIAAEQKFNDFLISSLTEIITAMEDATSRYQDIVIESYTRIREIANEKINIQAKIELDKAAFDRQLEVTRKQYELERIQADIKVIEAKKGSGSMSAMDAAKAINDKQQEILTVQGQLIEAERIAAVENLKAQQQAAYAQMQENQRRIQEEADLQKAKIQSEMELLVQQGTLYATNIDALEQVNKSNNSAFAETANNLIFGLTVTFNRFGFSFAKTLSDKVGEKVGFKMSEAIKINAGELDSVTTKFDDATTAMIDWGVAAQDGIQARANAEKALAATEFRAIYDGYQQEIELANMSAEQKAEILKRDAAAEKENAIARMKDAAKSGDKQKEKLKELQDKYNDAVGKVKDAFVTLLKDIVDTIGSVVTKSLERKVEMAKVAETIANVNLAATSERLAEAQTKQQDLLQKEIALRDEIKESYKALAETQKTYIESLTGDDRSIKQSSRALIDGILDQKRKQIDLSRTIDQRIRQDSFVQSLEDRKLYQEKSLEEATAARVAAEEKLAQTQAMITQITSLLSGEMFKLANSLQSLMLAAGGVNEVVGMGAKEGFGMQQLAGGLKGFGNQLINNLFFGSTGGGNIFSNAITGLTNAAKSLFGASSQISKAVGAGGAAKGLGPMVSKIPPANPFYGAGAKAAAGGVWGTIGGAIGGAFQGFGVGQLVGLLTKDPGMGSSIGGAIGGALASGLAIAVPSIFASGTVLGGIASGIGSALGMAMNFAIPVVGALVGALIGRLFSKTPKAGASGQLTSEGYTMTSSYERKVAGGTARKLSDLAGSTLESVVDSLKTVGVQFKDIVNTSIGLRKNSITGASLEFVGGARFEKGGSGTSKEDLEGVAQFYLDSFVKGLRTGSLVVDKTVKSATDLQSAIDKFVNEDQSLKTIERLKEVLDYAQGFSDLLAKLGEAVPVTMEDALASIVEGAQANANAISAQYRDLKSQAADVFGTTSSQYAALNKKIKDNALAQLGLARGSDGIVRSVAKANEELNAGTLAIANIIEGISAFSSALVTAGFAASEAADIIDLALTTQLNDFIGSIGENLKNSIDVLKNPAVQSAIELQAIIENAADRNKQAEGVLAGLRAAEGRIEQSTIDKAISNVAMSVELGALQVEKYLESLNIEQLKAVIADEDRIDAATKLAASNRLVALEDQNRSQAAKQFVKVSRDFNKSIAEITKSSAIPQFVKQATSVVDIAEILGRTSIDQFSIDFANLVNTIGRGENISGNFTTAVDALKAKLAEASITPVQFVQALDLLQQTALDSIQVLYDLTTAYEDTTNQINELYSTALDNLLTSTEEIGSSFNDLLDGFKDKTQSVLGIFDDTLKSVAESGNKLYTLRDNAKEAFDSATKAVAEFEKTNKLTGRTVAAVTADLASVSSQITSLSAKPFDFASFLNLGSLSSKQRSLQAELVSLSKVQEEYTKLVAAETAAKNDYNFANDTVTRLESEANSKLLDTRRTESETVQEVKDAALEFVTSQQDLRDITQLLTAANFNLNQARFEERDRVVQMSEALRDLTSIAGNLISEITSINATDVNAVKRTAQLDAEREYGTADTARITAAVNKAVADFNALKAVTGSVTSVVNNTVGVGATFTNAIAAASTTLKIYDSLLTDSFEGYTKTISGYITNITTLLKTSFDATDTTNFTGFVTNLSKTQDALQLVNPTLNQLLADSKLGVIAGITQSIGESVSGFQYSVTTAIAGLLDAFSTDRKSKIDAFREALTKFDTVGATINATGGLKEALTDANTQTGDLASKLTPLVTSFASLNTEVAKLNDVTNTTTKAVTPGQLSQARAKITEIATALQTAWNNVQFQVSTNLGTGITVNANVNAGSALTTADRSNLKSIAANSSLFPALKAVGSENYTKGSIPGADVAYAEGGYVQGPGSGTSDSISAKLSNGEYVIKASTVKRVGKNLLDEINTSGNLGYALSKQGRNGDSLVAHVNSEEVRMLLQSGGSGTFNPKTGLMEFFNKDGGVYGGLFAAQEADKLYNDFNGRIPYSDSDMMMNAVNPGGFIRMDNATGSSQIYPWNPLEAQRLANGYFSAEAVMKQIANSMMLASVPRERRGMAGVTGSSFGIASSVANGSLNNLYIKMSDGSIRFLTSDQVGIGPDIRSSTKVRGGLAARTNQTLQLAAAASSNVTRDVNTSRLSKNTLLDYITDLNRDNGMFFDFYMLQKASAVNKGVRTVLLENAKVGETKGLSGSSTGIYAGPGLQGVDVSQAGIGRYRYIEPTGTGALVNPFTNSSKYAGYFSPYKTPDNRTVQSGMQLLPGISFNSMFASGGLVKRDSISAMLEPGEFVLRKQAVDRMGLDNAIRLNSTGSMNGDIDVEVNINNNGTNQTTVGTPEVRRENGKIVVDIILEDLRTNGPINRQIRSIR